MGGAVVALGVYVEDGSVAAAWRPGLDAGRGLEVEVAARRAGKVQLVGRGPGSAGEGKDVLAFASGAVWDLTETLHLGIKDGEPSHNTRLV